MAEQNNENVVNSGAVAPMQTTNIASVNSRAGFAAFVSLAIVWVMSLTTAYVLNNIIINLFGIEKVSVGSQVIILISVAVPLVPIFLFSNRKLNKMITENASIIEDINLKKQIRRSLKWAIIIGALEIAYGLYDFLNVTFLQGEGNSMKAFVILVVYAIAYGVIALYSWSYYNKMKS